MGINRLGGNCVDTYFCILLHLDDLIANPDEQFLSMYTSGTVFAVFSCKSLSFYLVFSGSSVGDSELYLSFQKGRIIFLNARPL